MLNEIENIEARLKMHDDNPDDLRTACHLLSDVAKEVVRMMKNEKKSDRFASFGDQMKSMYVKSDEEIASDRLRKPPMGVMNRYIIDHDRFLDLCGAISRRYDAGMQIPIDWVQEYNELVIRVKVNHERHV